MARRIVHRVALAASVAVLVVGVAMIWVPAALIVAGLTVGAAAVLAIGGEA